MENKLIKASQLKTVVEKLNNKNTSQDEAINSKVSTDTYTIDKASIEKSITDNAQNLNKAITDNVKNLNEKNASQDLDISSKVAKDTYTTDKAALESSIAEKTTTSLNGAQTNVNFISENGKVKKINDMLLKADIENGEIDSGKLSENLKEILFYGFSWSVGGINTDGTANEVVTRIHSQKVQLLKGHELSVNDSNYELGYVKYASDGTVQKNTGYIKNTIIEEDGIYVIFMRKIDNTSLANSILQTSFKLTSYHPNSIKKKIDSIQLEKEKTVSVNDIVYGGSHTITNDIVTINSTGSTSFNTATLNISIPSKHFIILEFDCICTESDQADIIFGFGVQWGNKLLLNNTKSKRYKVPVYNHDEVYNSFIQFRTKNNCSLSISNISYKIVERLQKQTFNNVRFIGHRGINNFAPENTMISYRLAEKFGFFAVECDARLTADGKWVLCHDETIDRTSNGTGKVSDYTYDQLLNYDFGSKFNSQFAGEKIPLLSELLLYAKTYSVHVYIELKSTLTQDNIDSFISVVLNNASLNNCTFLSSDINVLKLISEKLFKNGRYAYSNVINETTIADLKTLGDNIVFDCGETAVTDESILLARKNGIEVELWTINHYSKVATFLQKGISGFTTDYISMDNFTI